MQPYSYNSYSIINNIGRNIALLWTCCVLLQFLFQGTIHTFSFISGVWLLFSYLIIKATALVSLSRSDFIFKTTLFFMTFLWGGILIFFSSELLIYYSGAPFIGLDDVVYHDQQQEIANKLLFYDDIRPDLLMSGFYSGYPNFGGVLMYFVGSTHWLVPRVATLLMFSMSTLVFYSIMKKCYSIKSSRLTSLIYGLSPLFLLYAITQMKDSLVVVFILLTIKSVIGLSEGKKYILNTLLLLLSLFCLIPIRAMVIVSLLISISIYYLISRRSYKIINFILLCFVLISIYALWYYSSSLGLFMDPNEYYNIRFENLGNVDKMAGSESILSKMGYAYLISAPLFILISPFLPIPTALLFSNPLYPDFNVNFAGNLFLYALIPYFISSLYIWFIKKTFHKSIILFIAIFFTYKFGSALSGMTLWSFRQTLPAMLVLLMIIPVFFDNLQIKKGQKATKFVLYILIICWSLFRLYIRS